MTPIRSPKLLASARTVRLYDAAAVAWVVLWLVVGVWSGWRLWQLGRVADGVAQTARGLDHTGQALEGLGGLPLVGSASQRLGQEIRSRAMSVITSAESSGRDVHQLGVLVGFAIAIGPSVGVAGLYLPVRRAYAREVRAARRAIETGPAGQTAEMLALRAVQNLPYDTLSQLSAHPLADLSQGRFQDLAGAEAARLGLRWPPDSPQPRPRGSPRSSPGPP